MDRLNQITIVGVGLIGASIGLAVRRAGLAAEVVGVGRRAANLRKAKACGAIDSSTTDLAKSVARADLVVVCTPVGKIAEIVGQLAAHCPTDCLITDAGSTKRQLVAEIEATLGKGSRFVGSHPVAGSEKSGPEHGRADLFDDRVVVVTPTRKTPPEDLRAVCEFWKALGAKIAKLSPAEHDRALAATSHLPHLAAAAIAAATPERYAQLVATGWLGTTRIAAGDPEMWTQIAEANRDEILASLARLEKQLAAYREAIAKGDGKRLTSLLTKAKQIRDDLGK